MKRALIGLLSAAMILSNVQLTVFAQESDNAIQAMADSRGNIGRLDVVLRMDYRESAETLAGRNLSLTLKNVQNGTSQTLSLGGEDSEQEFNFGGAAAKAAVMLRNPQDAPLGGNDKVGFYLVEFTGLPLSSQYHVEFTGDGFRKVEENTISNEEYAPKLFISAESGGFALGDATGDHKILQEDLDKVSNALGKSDAGADLNRDGVVDITDIALVNHNRFDPRQAERFEGAMVTAGVIETVTSEKEMNDGGTIVAEGYRFEDLFVDNGQSVKLEQINPDEKTCVLPITFTKPKEMSEINIISPAGVKGALEQGTVLVEYIDENGVEQKQTISYGEDIPEDVHAIERNAANSTVVIKLNGRVAVKKITITVERVVGEDGKATSAIIDKIEFLRDIIPENIDLGASIPKDVYAVPGDKTATLGWKKVDNVDGYIVKYGESSSNLSLQKKVGSNEAVIEGLENLKEYFFTVSAYSGEWTGKPSGVITCTPQPTKVPRQPDMVNLTPADQAITISWKKTEDAEFYNVYYKETEASEFKLANEEPIKSPSTSLKVDGLKNDVSYDFYVVAGNQIGFGPKSLTATGKPEKEILNIPTLPTMNRISNSAITKAWLQNNNNVSPDCGSDFDISSVYDGDFETFWAGRAWWESSKIFFEFDEEQSMDYLIYVPRLNKPWPSSFSKYSITVWDEAGNETHLTFDNGTLANGNGGDVAAPTVQNNPSQTGYAILPFERNDHIKRISVMVRQWDGSKTPASLSEIAFYTYDDIDDSIAALFTDSTYTVISPSATQARIDELRARIESSDGYYVNREILADELDLAEALLKGDTSKLGAVMDNVQSRNASGDKKKINTFQPLGVVAEANKQIVIYAEIPEGETVTIVPTQHFAEAGKWTGSSVQLVNGRNIITIPSINSVSPQKGGSLYVQYSGSKASEIKMQIRGVGATKIPMLELSDWHELSESEVKERISAYVTELNSYYTAKLSGMNSNTLQTHFLNATEIAFPHVLLSIPASQVRAALGSDAVQTIYNDGLAWEELMKIMYRTHGIDEEDLEASQSRHNIRYMRMFGNAFMYASGNHIGIGYGSCSGMVAGRPTSVTGQGSANGLFGWGIHHEIGHVMDTLGKAEITNNIYALFAQTYDADQNTLPSRLEKSNKYEKIFDKVTSGQKGMSNDVFVSLGMYWQLHLAYDGANDNFYNEVNKELRNGGYSGSIDQKFMAAASNLSGYDLTEFFKSWGLDPTDQGGSPEERKLQYLTDESRRERLKGTQKQSGTVGISASYDKETREATVVITPVSGAKMTGYEISRELNGITEPVAFLSTASGKTEWKDTLGSVNNKAVVYSVKAIDILGYEISEATADEIMISHDNLIDRNSYTWDDSKLADGVLTAEFSGNLSVAGIKFNNFPADSQTAKAAEKQLDTTPEEDTTGENQDNADANKDTNTDTDTDIDTSGEAEKPAEPNDSESSSEPADTPEDGDSKTEGDSSENKEENSPDNTVSEPESNGDVTSSEDNKGDEISAQSNAESPTDAASSQDNTDASDAPESSSSSIPSSSSSAESDSSSASSSSSSAESDSSSASSSSSSAESDSSSAPSSSSSEVPSSSSNASNNSIEQKETTTDTNTGDTADKGKIVTVEVSVDGKEFTTVLEASYEDIQAKADTLHFFTRKDHDGSICPFDAKIIRISGLPEGIDASSIDFAAYPGDYIEFGENGIGILARDFDCGNDNIIKAGSLIVTGSFRGNPVFNTVRVYGKTQSGDMAGDNELVESGKTVIEGEVYLFAALPQTGDMAEIDNGLWIFVPKQQSDTESAEDHCTNSLLPTEIMAELHRTDVPEDATSNRITSYTRWIPSPTYETMPNIILED